MKVSWWADKAIIYRGRQNKKMKSDIRLSNRQVNKWANTGRYDDVIIDS